MAAHTEISDQAKAYFSQSPESHTQVSIDDLVKQFQTDTPKIGEAMKTYLSFLMASDLTATDADAGAGGSSSPHSRQVLTSTYMTIARKVLAAVNSATVADAPPSSLEAHAPHEYEVAARLVRKVKEGNGKVTTLFGRRYFTALQNWEFIEKLARAQLASTADGEVLDAFLRGFRSTLLPDGADGADESMRRLVWSKNLKKTLAQRQEERKQEVAARNAAAGQNDLEDVKGMLASGAGGAAGPTPAGPTITELAEEEVATSGDVSPSTMDEIEPVRSARNVAGNDRASAGGQRLGGAGGAEAVPLGAVLQDAAAAGDAPVVEHYRVIDGVKTRIG